MVVNPDTTIGSRNNAQCEALRALRHCPVLWDVSDRDLVVLTATARRLIHDRGVQIAEPPEGPRSIYLVANGAARITTQSAGGREIVVAEAEPYDLLGLVYLDPTVTLSTVVVVSANRTVLYRLPASDFRRFLIAHPNATNNMLILLSHRLAEAYENMSELRLNDAKTRLAHRLAKIAEANQQHLVWTTHAELATMVGTTQERITKLLREFRTQGLIIYQYHRHGITVPDPLRLAVMDTG